MRFLAFALLAIIAAAMVIALIVGVTLKIVGLLILAFIVVAAVTWIMRKVRGPERGPPV